MLKPKVFAVILVCLLLSPILSPPALAADRAVVRVVVVQTDDTATYVREIEKGRAILKRLGTAGTIRVWRARFAGDQTNSVVVAIEYPSLAAFAKDDAAVAADAEYQTWIKGLDRIRKVVADSIYEEMR
jgi:hypothetical protein